MRRKSKSPEDLSISELRRLLMEKRRNVRQDRLEHYRRTGRVIQLASNETTELDINPVIETPANEELAPVKEASPRKKSWGDRLLLAIEVVAVLGLIGIILSGFGILRNLNDEFAAALEQPTMVPTPLVMAVVLPSGHTPPDTSGNTRPNEAEIPDHLRPMVQSIKDLPIPPSSPEQAIRIQIPALNVDAPIVQGDGWEQLKKGVAQHLGTPNPGSIGNMVLSAHNDVYGEIFRYLDQLQPGDEILVFTQQRQYTYVISGTQIVEPTQVEVMAATSTPTTTLISCYPYLKDNQRIVVFADLKN
ncbi:MAG: class D sortase [Anaerolineae bacterium]|jgi:sortase A|nr:class D sortase [Anaerolineae bacterium]MBT3714084.1 class D sortase [Anaerolineae bacterium]MBT4311334.1 class D sortase [Anaerolineae bacterium]MBT4456949.1 class D sortase [Anaerolineae bacterium]MBT6061773.1 class D sortase [Anaerolineae bacterium]